MRKTKDSGITLIALVVTIIVLLILAAVSLSMLTGEGGIIKEARDAKEQSEIDSEKEILELATVKAIGGNKSGNLVFEEFDKAMQSYVDKSKYTLEQQENGVIKVTFTESGRYYYVSADGDVTLAGTGTGTGGSGTGGSGTGDGTGGSGTGGNTGTGDTPPTGTPGNRYEEETKVTIDGKPVTIPGGATISGVEGENTIEGGLVIYIIPSTDILPDWNNAAEVEYAQKTYSQFVWIPVENAILDLSGKPDSLVSDETIKSAVELEMARGRYPMAVKKADGNYMGVLYQFSKSVSKDEVVIEPSSKWTPLGTTLREPDITSYDNTTSYLNQINGILGTNYSNSTELKGELQTEFNTMVERVRDNKGFWVGRYDTSNMSNSTTTSYIESNEVKINVVKGATAGITEVTWYRMYAQQKIYAQKANLKWISSMIWGSQWDQIMIWMRDLKLPNEDSYYIVRPKNSSESTGTTTGYCKSKNIFDLDAVVVDSTMLNLYTDRRVRRGGSITGASTSYGYQSWVCTYGPGVSNEDSYPHSATKYEGSRCVLY